MSADAGKLASYAQEITAKKDERIAVEDRDVVDSTDDQEVIAERIGAHDPTRQRGQRFFDVRHAPRASPMPMRNAQQPARNVTRTFSTHGGRPIMP